MNGFSDETVYVGIDEAGLGPILGPLVVSAAAFSLPAEKANTDMWQLLADSVSANKKHLAGRILVCDSKKAYTPAVGIGFLEKTVLTFLKLYSKTPQTSAELLDLLCPQNKGKILESPWYKTIDQEQIKSNADEISISASVLKRNLASAGINIVFLRSCCLDAASFNELAEKMRNKSAMVFHLVCRLIDETIWASRHNNFHFVIDRQGGRMRYAQQLRTMFSRMDLKIISEDENLSSYQLTTADKSIRVDFKVKADGECLPVCLASMVCKYIRERLMISFNNYFIGKCAELKPTAGYWTDGKRFIEDLKTIAPHIRYNPRQLVRSR